MSLTKATFRMTDGAEANVLDFGADPTGVASSSTAIQAAINSGKKRVYFPAGTYLVDSQVTWNSVDLIGVGANFGSKINCTASGTVFKLPATTKRCRIEGLGFIGTGSNICFGADTDTYSWRQTTIANCNFSTFDIAVDVKNSLFFYVENCEFDLTQGIIFGGTYNNCAELSTCYFDGNQARTYGVHFNMTSLSQGNTITLTNCAFDDYNTGCSIRYGKATLTNCYWEDNSAKHLQGDNATIIVNGGHMQGQTGTGTANAYNLETSTLREVLEPRFNDNFAKIYSIQSNSKVFTPNGYNASNVQILTGGKYYQDVFAEGDDTSSEFEEGTWTPGFGDGAGSNYTGTFSSTPTGYYMRTGNSVFVSLTIVANQSLASNGLTGGQDLTITGLPFAANATNNSAMSIAQCSAINLDSGYSQILSKVSVTKSYIEVLEVGDNVASRNLQVTDCDATGATFVISGTYRV
ncbi:MAG: hypothetical protein CMJ25_15210 [Phycisphaerae bacterium]|nr:hypothetical protein [Phycisphaerae bacterium]|tara:strand:+ start:2952 stop:4343 length:1392 start_codon:yes stop_codon:yes gene_type:complete